MEKPMRRNSKHDANISGGKHSSKQEDYASFKLQTRGEYEDLMMEFEFRCRRAAMMHYYEASRLDNKIFYVEMVSALIGGASMTSVGAWILRQQTSFDSFGSVGSFDMSSLASNVGPIGAFGLGLVFLIQMVGKGSSKILPSFSKRKLLHVECAAAWQKLAMETRSYRIQLDNPTIDVDTYAAWFTNLTTERQKLCSQVCVPQSTYKLYCDPMRVFRPMKQRRLMFIKFLQLEDLGVDDVDDINDFKLSQEL